ncbi:hypothetical protein B9Q02_09140 [Candidatus Marsarchaeota G1 archaeon BE_D]|jgi:hypothetical protein|uniref:Uncharacterized protein n=2 Tax=Candidatus Marsarchaeota TaxID=1978152 RepID=A0A2R6C2L7_9ARCH|nr:MAG: hypothetical protein B9Q02_09140 [Candidatus Marsarchaeota G1 archaeon BE_D]PSO05139.1 MAG: hypothetical protein B9Q12_01045 [Candidatus Marsarchaeota G2 archaeon ECH_B_SAG-G06]
MTFQMSNKYKLEGEEGREGVHSRQVQIRLDAEPHIEIDEPINKLFFACAMFAGNGLVVLKACKNRTNSIAPL